MECSFNLSKQALEPDQAKTKELMIKNDLIDSICEIPGDKLLMQAGLDLLVMSDWQIASKVTMTSGISLEKSSLIPDFDFELFPFIVDYGSTDDNGHSMIKSHSFNLVNIRSGRVDTLINGSAQNFMPQQAIFLTKSGEGRITMDFCTVRHNVTTSLYEQSWHQMSFNTDFTDMLRKYGRIPKLNSMQECVEMEC